MNYLCAFALSTLGGHLVVGLVVFLMRKTILPDRSRLLPKWRQQWYYFWVGCTERAIATALFIWAPTQLGLFIGGWAALKLAAAWSRRTDDDHTLAHIIALVGTAISFSIAIAAGMWAHPQSLIAINGNS